PQGFDVVHGTVELRGTVTARRPFALLVIRPNQHGVPFGPAHGHQPEEYEEPCSPGDPTSSHNLLPPQRTPMLTAHSRLTPPALPPADSGHVPLPYCRDRAVPVSHAPRRQWRSG